MITSQGKAKLMEVSPGSARCALSCTVVSVSMCQPFTPSKGTALPLTITLARAPRSARPRSVSLAGRCCRRDGPWFGSDPDSVVETERAQPLTKVAAAPVCAVGEDDLAGNLSFYSALDHAERELNSASLTHSSGKYSSKSMGAC
jgi:hypothetical protein